MIKINEDFRKLIPALTVEEYAGLEANCLAFRGLNKSKTKFLEILPSTMGNCYWFVSLSDTDTGIQDYTKRPVAASRIKFMTNFVDWNEKYLLKAERYSPLPIDYYDEILKDKIKGEYMGDIYFIQAIVGGPVKIGISKSVESRLKTFQTGCPFELRVLKTMKNITYKHEKQLHKKYSKYRLHGEWFSDEVLNQIK